MKYRIIAVATTCVLGICAQTVATQETGEHPQRADAVRAYLETLPPLSDIAMETRGAGLGEPVADNETEEGRQQNRRVEIIAIP